MQILAAAPSNDKMHKFCSKKTLLTLMLGVQAVSNIFYLYPLLYLFYGFQRLNILTIATGLILCICFLISYAMLLCKDPGQVRS